MQAEHGTGMSLAMNSMVVLNVGGAIVLFPGMPVKIDAAFHSLRLSGAILVSAEQRNGRVTHAAFQSLHGGPLCVRNPFDPVVLQCPLARVQIRRIDTGAIIATVDRRWRELVEWVAEPGIVYRMELVEST